MKPLYIICSLIIALLCGCSSHEQGPIHVDQNAIAVNALDINEDEATVSVDFDVINATGAAKSVKATVEIIQDHKTIDTQMQEFEASDTTALSFSFNIPNPELTTSDYTNTYQACIKLKSGIKVLDEFDKNFELRPNEFISLLEKREINRILDLKPGRNEISDLVPSIYIIKGTKIFLQP